jgi:hypothetical protein
MSFGISFMNVDLSECRIWDGPRTPAGYGYFRHKKKTIYMHRFVIECVDGPIPEGLEPDHLCRNRPCYNYDHLELVTHRINMLRGDTIVARQVAQTHCKRGHEFSGDNLRIWKNKRQCRACDAWWHREQRRVISALKR